ncbi:putative damage-inducible protein DinB [Lysinibacillus composti]|uniref:Damage-inducible protein DinB n=1 Tax=Lysinibacillus composti TaxID=720633 RepID=A0A3N9UA43_9BACI|nr:DinB family protein [Lysinibacillus composti]MBM7607485.1 putative damage-inducible protein DinB [Lysinibacillus composti]RQW73367.1 damage-inducible protein DinB [Lysinibacillus composti]
MKEELIRLFDYHVWANERIKQHLKNLSEDILLQKVNSVFPTIAETIGHIITADETWYLRMQGKGDHIKSIQPKRIYSVDDIVFESTSLYAELRKFLLDADFDDQIVYQNTKGEQFNNRISEIVQHIVNHGTYHRGNIAAMIRQQGHRGISTDYIQYIRTLQKNQI